MKSRALNPGFALALCYAGMVCLAIAVNLMPVFLTSVRVDLGGRAGLTDEQLGRISAITFAGLVGGILFTGPLADRWGGKSFSVLGTLLIGVGLGLLGISPGYSMVLVAVFIMGLGAGILDMVLSPIVAVLQPGSRATALNWLHSFYGIGTVVTVLVGTLAFSIRSRMAHDFPDSYHRSASGGSRIRQRRSASAHLGKRRRPDSIARSLSRLFFPGSQCGDLSWRRSRAGAGAVVARVCGDEPWVLNVGRKYLATCVLGCHGIGAGAAAGSSESGPRTACWRPRRDLNPCYRRERARIYWIT